MYIIMLQTSCLTKEIITKFEANQLAIMTLLLLMGFTTLWPWLLDLCRVVYIARQVINPSINNRLNWISYRLISICKKCRHIFGINNITTRIADTICWFYNFTLTLIHFNLFSSTFDSSLCKGSVCSIPCVYRPTTLPPSLKTIKHSDHLFIRA